uniref:Uncharacterized protein n=1 Tax=Zea mays TaxID=4577 RepID=A0A804UKT3_MAIZE
MVVASGLRWWNSEEHPLERRLLLHGFGVDELAAAVPGVPPLLRPDEPGQEPPDLLPPHLRLPPRRLRRLVSPPCRCRRRRWRRLLTSRGRHQRLREGGGGVGEGGAGDNVDRADVRGERGAVARRGRAAGGARGCGRRGRG